MGVSGAGKTTVGRLLARRTGWAFHDADDYHDADNIEKMRRGIPLTDADRIPWLERLRRDVVAPILEKGDPTILACSALKASYLERLGAGDPRVRVIYLTGDERLFRERLQRRAGHFMDAGMLASQFGALQEPDNAVVVDAAKPLDAIVDEIMRTIGLPRIP
jgi:carbohydrate kinase (thermoresistant glucokinase family)